MEIRNTIIYTLALFLCSLPNNASASEKAYKRLFLKKVYHFGNKNRFNLSNVNRDKYFNCIMQATIKTTVSAKGEVINVEVIKPAPAPKVNKYFIYIINQASPYHSLENYLDSDVHQFTFEQEFKLKVSHYENSNVTAPCN
ncbi:hypothetical protein [Zooshikella ganghwensis]|uniref:Uncharacterized protein n=1 Tax=Zooshikella ganghwensis TaxID=202772 RepID=A0A4P9VSQ4_9GAMM|nr:hypothetical protein [Zooshikella ganghwensis]RDH45262.1 hypothetical protein B9G39_18425 [Zooshikella ganghwensis]